MNMAARDTLKAEACDHLKGHFVPIPDAPAKGSSLANAGVGGGRWIISDCDVEPGPGSQISFHLSGPLWSWVNRVEPQGWGVTAHVEQYIYATADLRLLGDVTAQYDTRTQVMSVWLQPQADVRVEPIQGIPIRVETSGVLDIFVSNDEKTRKARAAVETEGRKEVLEAFANGITITRSTAHGQLDFAIGHRPLGVVPTRPFRGTDQYLVNLQQALRPGSIAVDGPFPAGASVTLDATVGHGTKVGYHAYCQDYVMKGYDHLFQQGTPLSLVNVPTGTTWIQPDHEIQTTLTPPEGCAGKWVIVTGVPPNPPSPNLPHDTPPTILNLGVRVSQR
jgi:hypothetical protein